MVENNSNGGTPPSSSRPKQLPHECYTASIGPDLRTREGRSERSKYGTISGRTAHKDIRRQLGKAISGNEYGQALRISQRTHEIINLHVAGYTAVEIAAYLNISRGVVDNALTSATAQPKIMALRQIRDEDAVKVQEVVRIARNRALQVMMQTMDGCDEEGNALPVSHRDKINVATTMLKDISGLAVHKTESVNLGLTAQDFEEFKARGMRFAADAGLIVDAEVEPAPEPQLQSSAELPLSLPIEPRQLKFSFVEGEAVR